MNGPMTIRRILATLVLIMAPALSAAQMSQNIDIGAQPLEEALTELSSETGLSILAQRDVLKGKQSRAVQGLMTPQEALAELLLGTELEPRALSDNRAVVSSPDIVSQNADFEDDTRFDLGTIVLGSQLISKTVEESEVSAAVFSEEQLEERGETSVRNLLIRTPNVSVLTTQGEFSIRGVSRRGIGGVGAESGDAVTTEFDGITIPRTILRVSPISLWDVEQVEILRGPQSTQLGRNAKAGAIVIRSKDPVFENEASLRFDVGTFDYYRAAVAANAELLEDRLALRFSFERYEDDGATFNITTGNDRDNFRDFYSLRTALRWAPTDNVDVVLSYRNTKFRRGNEGIEGIQTPGGVPLTPTARIRINDVRQELDVDTDQLGLKITWDINDAFKLTSETSYLSADEFEQGDLFLLPIVRPEDPGFRQIGAQSLDSFEQDLRLQFDYGSVVGTVGLFYTQADDIRASEQQVFVGNVPPPPNLQIGSGRSIMNAAIFGEADIGLDAFAPGFTLTLGARYDYEEIEGRGLLAGENADFDAFLPKLGISYSFSENQDLSFTYQRAYRAGGAGVILRNQLDPQGNFVRENYTFDAEFSDNFEIAYRAALFDERVRVRGNVFYAQFDDLQVNQDPNPLDGFDRFTTNAGGAEHYGVELSIDADVTSRLLVYGSVGYLETNFTEFVDTSRFPTAIFTGNEFAAAPTYTFALGAQYRWQNGLTVGVDMSFTDDAFITTDNNPLFKIDDFFLVDVNASYRFRNGVTLGAYVRNLFDETYATSNFGQFGAVLGEPLTAGAFLAYEF